MVFEVFNDGADNLRGKLISLYTVLIAANVLAWCWAFIAFRDYPVLLGTSLLAYTFGLRHAFDADHIAAIDNVTRKLMQENKRPITVGFFFSLGHSSVVFGLSLIIAATAAGLQASFSELKAVGSVIGTTISASFLFAIAAANILVLARVYTAFQRVKCGGHFIEGDIDLVLAGRGLLGRIFRRVFRLVHRSWHMYPVGVLFGLGFDTATEVGLLGIAASEASQGLPIWSILVFPALFAAGMSLADTFDGTLMLGAYDWALLNPLRKLYYNMIITAACVLIALLAGGVQLLGLATDKLSLHGPFWQTVTNVIEHFSIFGFVVVGLFVASWAISVAVHRTKGYDGIKIATE
jgi:high-affinity nickel-transport protein